MPRPLTDEEVTLAHQLLPHPGWVTGFAQVTEQGSNYRVALLEGVGAIRMGRTPEHAHTLERLATLLPALADQLPYAIPQPLSATHQSDLGPAMAFSYVPGIAHPHINATQTSRLTQTNRSAQPVAALGRLLSAMLMVNTAELVDSLAQPYSYRGPWDDNKTARTYNFVATHAPEVSAQTAQLLSGIHAHPHGYAPEMGLVHGDLAGENMKWDNRHRTVTGILDWDLASRWDPSINLSHLSLWHGPDIIAPAVAHLLKHHQITAEEQFGQRAHYFSGVLALENISDAATRQLKPSPLRRLLKKVIPRIQTASEYLKALN